MINGEQINNKLYNIVLKIYKLTINNTIWLLISEFHKSDVRDKAKQMFSNNEQAVFYHACGNDALRLATIRSNL